MRGVLRGRMVIVLHNSILPEEFSSGRPHARRYASRIKRQKLWRYCAAKREALSSGVLGEAPRVRTHYFHTLQKRVGMETEVTMSTLFYLSSAQMDTIRPFFPRSRGVPRVDDQKILSGIIYVLKFGLQWKDAPKEYGPYKTLYNRFVRWSKMGVFEKIFTALAENSQDTSLLMIDATHLKAHRTAASLRKKGLLPDVSDEQRED